MVDHVKQTKEAINAKKQEIQSEEALRAVWVEQHASIDEINKSRGDTEDEALAGIRVEISESIARHDATLNRLRPELAALEAQLPQTTEPVAPAGPKFDPEKHPVLRKILEKQEPEQAVVFRTGDVCEAQWTDRAWYKAKIQSILGSASAPKYLVRFIEYDDTLTVDGTAVRPVQTKRKREPEPASAPQPSAPFTSTPHVISGPASMNPNAQLAKTKVEDTEGKKKSRVPNSGTLKKRASLWNDFQTKATKKGITKKESMFRTSTKEGSRVGFTGSGKGMTETNKRKRYDYKADRDDEEYSDSTGRNDRRY
ncbi:hypothetical protein BDW02DRAFT_571225 [Decorospora gaudefroyi]|uniref:Tudor domain-containing protein n=1 Tax=Decorospora gaudefroyi TaxID=184978 RepID=A0A6A5KFX7_9PLEO|nr:hypothetical protein BDW02DRAFT_571225 [Decorospora gaudefroyi]